MKKYRYFLVLFSAFSHLLFSQQKKIETYKEIRKSYEKMAIDDIRAMPQVRYYIQKAKKEKKFRKLIQGYRDGRQFDLQNKIKYSDSAIQTSLKYGTNLDISNDYLSKGIIYYFYQKKYKLALDEYLKAHQYSKGLKDQYNHYKVIYHLGIVKTHLGYFDEALEHFQECLTFYSSNHSENLHVNEKFNYKKAYLNSLHQITVINRYLKNFEKSDSLSNLGYEMTVNNKDFSLENSYFLKCNGISEFHNKRFQKSSEYLSKALPVLLEKNDFAWSSVVYFYLGKISEAQNNTENVLYNYSKVDSIFQKHQVILPEVIKSYNYLIEHYKNKDVRKQLFYTNQLLRVDSLLTKDFSYLSSTLHKDYDRKTLIEEKDQIMRSGNTKIMIAKILIISGSVIIFFFTLRFFRDRKIKRKYILLQERIAEGTYYVKDVVQEDNEEFSLRKTTISPEMTLEIKKKLKKFENELQFKKKGLTQKSIAIKLGTNSHYLSIYINENKGMNFNKYMAQLRINYITNLLNTNNKYLQYTIEALAEECGIAARQNFTNLFIEINGIRPTDYIKNRKKELGIT
ncbi:AraC family transcriptional regulator [Chryseobacterium sp. Ch-15]|uniref:AraC family transcriptional regulator n=1 Tax=Chryseobacterium muglaense TaxID=2893752 RepID=A0A9Q3UXE9_9FLAO|nr:AraC family transcriptional regulator [Chryseobacterium muglaense]MBD3905401.1 AraC family transcriptional regulator [Chryseobacterium muglaense]MCC9036874.1 AraC family transcriptional regulator [Chryseobacterium muglaense]MCM2555264.1 AraC family transcriptional regulator [Chryseobacterium muglaense]